MIHRFEQLTTGVSQIYKNIQRIKKIEMRSLGLKGTHVMCLYFLYSHPDGLTAADLCNLCKEDKAGISRILSDLEEHGFIRYTHPQDKKKYRSKAVLTDSGKKQSRKVNRLILRAVLEGGRDITAKERDIFYRVLFMIAGNLDKFCEELEESSNVHFQLNNAE
ncbi:MAG: MarR family transcriptional regulator [Dorea sp.]|jgi:DNA-binding MarR family transcriptional regulator|nr:MarR family transcriptional regulator [Dorea sp.]MCI9227575.1 MarR family transcriptional regulator [Dorea sp.]